MASTASCYHVVILFEHHIAVVVEVEQVDGEELVRYAAGRVDAPGELQGVNDGLHCGVVRGPHVLAQREGAGTLAVVRIVAPWRHNPAGPADLLKVDIEWQALARRPLWQLLIERASDTRLRRWDADRDREGGATMICIKGRVGRVNSTCKSAVLVSLEMRNYCNNILMFFDRPPLGLIYLSFPPHIHINPK